MSELLDYFAIVAILVVFGIAIFASQIVLTKFSEATKGKNIVNDTIVTSGQQTILRFDLIFVIVLFGSAIALFVTAFLVDTHPAFLPFNILVFIILIYVAGIFSNTFIRFAETQALTDTANQYENMIFIWRNLPYILTILAGVNMVVMFAKVSQRRGNL